MKALIHRTVFFVFILTGFVLSCKKQGSNSINNQKILAIDYGNQQTLLMHYSVSYDRTNRIDSIVGNDYTNSDHHFHTTFMYDARGYMAVREDKYTIHPWLSATDTAYIVTNTDGRIAEIYSSDSTDTLFMDYNYFMVTRLRYDSTPGAPYDIYTWDKGGNLDTIYNNANQPLATYSYDLSKNGNTADGIRLSQFLRYGQAYIVPRNLPTGCVYSATNYSNYTYRYDNAGRITQLKIFNTIVGASTNVVDTTYYNFTY